MKTFLLFYIIFTLWIQSESMTPWQERALLYNQELKRYQEEVTAMKGERTQAGLWKNPEVSLEYGERRKKNSADQLQNTGTTRSLSLSQTFEFPGKGSLRKAIANQNIQIAELGLNQFKESLQGAVELVGAQLYFRKSERELAEQIQDRFEILIQNLRERSKPGIAMDLESKLIEGWLLRFRTDAQRSIERDENVEKEFRRLVSIPSSEMIPIFSSTTLRSLLPLNTSEAVLLMKAQKENRLLQIHEKEWIKSQKEATQEYLASAPDLQLGPFYSKDNAGEKEVNMGVQLNLTLPLWNWNQGNIQSKNARTRQLAYTLEEKRYQLETQIHQSIARYQRHQKLWNQITADHIQKLVDAAEGSERHYRLGAVSVQLLIDTQQNALESLQSYHSLYENALESLLDLELAGALSTTPETIEP